jgi:hypothetical protein
MPQISMVVKFNDIECPLFSTAYKYPGTLSRNWRGKRSRDERDLFTAGGIYLLQA